MGGTGLTQLAQEQIPDSSTRRNYTELVESILIYKFPRKSHKEIAAMLGISDPAQIAQLTGLPLERVHQLQTEHR